MKKTILITGLLMLVFSAFSQDQGKYVEAKPGFYQQEILPDRNAQKEVSKHQYFVADLDGEEFPTELSDYKKSWFLPPVSQGATGTCWCFAATSFLESEAYRLHGTEVKISEMYTVYWEYVERARAFVQERGNIYFAQGSEAIGVLRMMKMHGAVPLQAYRGMPKGKKFHDHSALFDEMNTYLQSIKQQQAWNEEDVVATIQSILNHHLGTPPEAFTIDGREYTPQSFLNDFLKLKVNDYFSFMSTMSKTYGEKGELVEADNWWHASDYYNITPDKFINTITDAIEGGYTICICGDVSEAGYDSWSEIGIVPEFDIPSEYINASAREYRLNNGTTTDDHCIHLVGHTKKSGESWFLIKDSGAGGFNGPNKGYRFMHEDYVKLKMMNILLHKDGASVLDEMIK